MGLQTKGPADLELRGVVKTFGSTLAVDHVSASIRPGEFYSLLGPSGCGKTTTLRLVAGFERPDAGNILLAGDDITATPPERRKVNTVFQHYALFPHLTVEDNVAYGLRHSKLNKEDVSERLERGLATVRLNELRHRHPRELSGGQQQRVALARALVNEPTVLLLDEPLAALDLKLRKAMQHELKKLQERVGISFVYVTHDQEEALTLSDRIAVMNDGRILQEGTPSEIYERPTTRFVADFIGETNFFEGLVEDTGAVTVVRTKSGAQLRCAGVSFAQQGDEVTVSVRPESIVAVTGQSRPANVLEGILQRTTYLGDSLQHHVMLADKTEVSIKRQSVSGASEDQWRVGARIEIGWSEADALVVSNENVAVADAEARRLVEVEGPA
ncbi:MAG: spermidine/putrescine transport system ATP-binding protein [Actinomycetota bacterium]|nr:spermidine/putrescine transport system ATP-binding protein [Actinomycetota bacterium]